MDWQRIIAFCLVFAALAWLLRPLALACFKKKSVGGNNKHGACGGCSCSMAVKQKSNVHRG